MPGLPEIYKKPYDFAGFLCPFGAAWILLGPLVPDDLQECPRWAHDGPPQWQFEGKEDYDDMDAALGTATMTS